MYQTSWRLSGIRRLLVLVFGLIFGARRTKPSFVVSLVDRLVSLWCLGPRTPAPELADTLVVKRLSSSHKDVVSTVSRIEPKSGGHLFEVTDNVVGLFFWRASRFLCRAFDIDAVFVGPG